MGHVDSASAIIPSEKLRDYLLSPTHPIGRYKAAFFTSLGYSVDYWPQLQADLRRLLVTPIRDDQVTEYGRKFVTRGVLRGPNGREAAIVAVWIVPVGQVVAHFVTAYPED